MVFFAELFKSVALMLVDLSNQIQRRWDGAAIMLLFWYNLSPFG